MSRFFSDEAYEPQVDPFNAGEPELPWNDPSALHDDASCEFLGDSGYEAREKPADDYQPPVYKEDERAGSEATEDDGQAATEPAADKRPASRRVPSAPTPDGRTAPTANRPAGQRRGGCRTVFIIAFILLFMAGPIMSGITSCVLGAFGFDYSDDDDHSTDDGSGSGTALEPSPSEDEQEASDAASEAVDDLLADPAFAQRIASDLSDTLETYTTLTAKELGVDADAYADWVLSQVECSVEDPYVYSEGTTGDAYLRVTGPDTYSLMTSAGHGISDYVIEHKLYGSSGNAPSKDDQDRIRAIFAQALEDAETQESLDTVELKKDRAVWRVDDSDELARDILNNLGIFEN